MPVILATQEVDTGGSQFRGKRFLRLHLNKKADMVAWNKTIHMRPLHTWGQRKVT
jgi:hypothetical protein